MIVLMQLQPAIGLLEHQEGAEGVGPSKENATEGGCGAVHLGKVLSRGDTGGVFVWGEDLGVVGANGKEAVGSSCGVPEKGEEVEAKEA